MKNTRSSMGFTLAELAIALLIVGLLLASAFVPISTQVELRSITETQRSLDQIKETLIGFALANGRLPCPARGQTPTGTIDTTTWAPTQIAAGAEQWDTTNNRCYAVLGVLPWSTLGLSETDSWGRRFTYRVAPAFADAPSLTTWQSRSTAYAAGGYLAQAITTPASPANQNLACDLYTAPTRSSFALCTLGDIAVLTRSDTNHSVVTSLGAGLPAVIISHGRNGYGAYLNNGQTVTGAGGGDEIANSSGTTLATPPSWYSSYVFYSRNFTPVASGCNDAGGTTFCEFDDIVTWISANVLVARMSNAGNLP
jgi:type II secretory pathway pseudopilin PulG